MVLEDLKVFINKENCFCFFNLTKLFSLQKLKIYLVSVVENNFVGFSKAFGFENIDYRTLKLFVSRSTIHVSSEIEVFEAIVNWIKYDEKIRKVFMCDLLKMVRLPMLSCEAIQKNVISNKLCQSCQKCCNHIKNVIALKENPNQSFFDSLENRCCINNFTHFNFSSHMASVRPDNGLKCLEQKLCRLETKSFEFTYSNGYEIFLHSIDSRGCETIKLNVCGQPDNCEETDNFAACMFMDKLYVTGGLDENGYETRNCASYDPKTAEWTILEEMQMARSHHSCVVFAGKIVVTGGFSGNIAERSVEVYDHFENKWSNMPDLVQRRCYHGSVAMGNNLYVIGGVDIVNCEVYNYMTKKFTLIKSMPWSIGYNDYDDHKVSFFRVENKIILKHDTEDKEKDNIYIYDIKEDKWSSMCVDYFKENKGNVMYK